MIDRAELKELALIALYLTALWMVVQALLWLPSFR